jgi:hypothetical protein
VLGWEVPSAVFLMQWDDLYPQGVLEDSSENLKKLSKSDERSKKAAIVALDKAIKSLADFGFDDKTIVGLSIILTQKWISSDELTHGGIINPAWLREVVGLDSAGFSAMQWLMWHFKTLDEAQKLLPSLD